LQVEPRAVPNYDGRGEPPTTFGDVAIWVPRLVLSPLYLVSEFLIRRPLGFVMSNAEREHIPQLLVEVFTFGPRHDSGIVPTAFVEFNARASVGLYMFLDNVIAQNNDVRVHVAYGGPDWLRLAAGDRIRFPSERSSLLFRGEASQRPDYVFAGIGPGSLQSQQSRYEERRYEGRVTYEQLYQSPSHVRATLRVRRSTFDASQACCDDPSLDTRIASQQLELPSGFEGLTSTALTLDGAYDTRGESEGEGVGSGVRVEGYADEGLSLSAPRSVAWLRTGGALGGYVDIGGDERVVSLSLAADLAEPLVGGAVSVHRARQLRRRCADAWVLEGRLRGQSGAAMILEYRWPIWVELDGRIQASVGNVFGFHFEGVRPENLRGSLTLGVTLRGRRDNNFSMLVGAGTEPFGTGFQVTSLRALVGMTRGF